MPLAALAAMGRAIRITITTDRQANNATLTLRFVTFFYPPCYTLQYCDIQCRPKVPPEPMAHVTLSQGSDAKLSQGENRDVQKNRHHEARDQRDQRQCRIRRGWK